MISINYRDSRPIYEQIADSLRMQIAKQLIAPDEKLPSVREIASELSINPNTIQRAIRQLEQEGYVYTVAGRGTFAANMDSFTSPRRQELLEKFDTIVKELHVYHVDEEELLNRMHELMKGGIS
ncbi:MAG: GntR family transcriptional regulator [Lachnospiraceae bacterium]